MLGDVVEAAVALGARRASSPTTRCAAAAGRSARWSTTRVAGREPRSRPASAAVTGPCLVVNADLPCATTAALCDALAAAGLAARGRPRTGRRTRSRSRIRRCSRRSTARAAPLGSGPHAGFVTVAIPELVDDVDTLADLERLAALGGRAHALRAVALQS